MWPDVLRGGLFRSFRCCGAAFSSPVAGETPIVSAKALLAANRAAVGDARKQGTFDARFAYWGQGLTGTARNTSDRATGAYVDSYDVGPMRGASGYDGRMPWMQDISGAYTPQDGGDRPRSRSTKRIETRICGGAPIVAEPPSPSRAGRRSTVPRRITWSSPRAVARRSTPGSMPRRFFWSASTNSSSS